MTSAEGSRLLLNAQQQRHLEAFAFFDAGTALLARRQSTLSCRSCHLVIQVAACCREIPSQRLTQPLQPGFTEAHPLGTHSTPSAVEDGQKSSSEQILHDKPALSGYSHEANACERGATSMSYT